jgi:hypothetical protein
VLVGYVLLSTPRIVVPALVVGEQTSTIDLQVFADLTNDSVREAVHALVASGHLTAFNGVIIAHSVQRGSWPGSYGGVEEVAPRFLSGFLGNPQGSEALPVDSKNGTLADASIAAQGSVALPTGSLPPEPAVVPAADSSPDLVPGAVGIIDAEVGADGHLVPESIRDVLKPEQLDGQLPPEPAPSDPE